MVGKLSQVAQNNPVKVGPHPRYATFVDALRPMRERMAPWTGTGYRAAELAFARSSELVSGVGAFEHGGRWNAPGSFHCVYLSATGETAYAESTAGFRYYGLTPRTPDPRVIVGVEIIAQAVLDLSAEGGRPAVVDFDEFLAEDWRKVNYGGSESLGQAFGRAVVDIGAEAMLVPSAEVPKGTNVVLFPRGLRPGHTIHVIGYEQLDSLIRKR
jgi:RES domain-containing protein